MLLSGGPPLAPSTGVSAPLRGGDGHAQPAGKQSRHPHSGPWHGEMVNLTLSDNIDHSADSAGPYNKRDPLSKLRLIGHHQEHRVSVIPCNPPH